MSQTMSANAEQKVDDLQRWRCCAPLQAIPPPKILVSLPTEKQQSGPHHADVSALHSKKYDREIEERMLFDAYQRCISPRQKRSGNHLSEIVLISGASGMGKSSLANSLRKVAEDTSSNTPGFFVSGKFDKFESPEHFYPIIQAFTEFAGKVEQRGEPMLSSIREDLAHLSGTGTDQSIIDLIPALQIIFNEQLGGKCEKGGNKEEAQKRLIYGLTSFIKAICSAQRPLVLFVDDLQWADQASLDLIGALISDKSIEGFMLLGACRDEEVRVDHRFAVTIRELESNGVGVSRIMVGPIDAQYIQEIIDDRINLPPVCSEDLADIIWHRTSGNPFFVMQVLRFLSEGQFLKEARDLTAKSGCSGDMMMRNEYTAQSWVPIRKSIVDHLANYSNAVELLSDTMLNLSKEVQDLLVVASCFGTTFNEILIRAIIKSKTSDYLVEACEKGLIENVGGSLWRFTHDQVHQSAHGLILEGERESVHLRIGRQLWKNLDQDQLNTFACIVVNQLRIGASLIENQDERDKMALLLLETSRKAASSSSFEAAAKHLNLAISLLDQDSHWRVHYELSLELYSAAAEMEYCNSNFDRTDELVDVALQNAKSIRDTLRVRTTYVSSLGTRGEFPAALECGLTTLRDLGEALPKKPRIVFVIRELMRTKRMLRNFRDDEIIDLPAMIESGKLMATRMMIFLFSYAHKTPQRMYSALIAMRLVQMTLREGVSSMSSVGFSMLGVMLCGPFGDIALGSRVAKLSLRLLDKFQANEWVARVYVFVYSSCFLYTEPWHDQLSGMLVAHRLGLGSGDMEMAFLASAMYTAIAIFASHHLSEIVNRAFSFLEVAYNYRHFAMFDFIRLFLQLALNLSGKCSNPLVLDGDAMVESAAWEEAVSSNNEKTIALFHFTKLTLFGFFQDHELAEKEYKMLSKCETNMFPLPFIASIWMYEGIAALALCQRHRTRKRVRIAKRNIRYLKNAAIQNPRNIPNKMHLLEAELAGLDDSSMQGRTIDKVLGLFRMSIEAAQNVGLHNEAGLAYERAGVYLIRKGKENEAKRYTEKAIAAYTEWGAYGKVEQLEFTSAERALDS